MQNYSLMSLYLFFLASICLVLFASRFSKRVQSINAYIIAISVSMFYGLRAPVVGVDTWEYLGRYNNGVVTEDYLFSRFSILLAELGLPSNIYLFTLALLTSLFLLKAIKNFSGSYKSASLFLLLIASLPYGVMAYINVVRQGLAVSLILYGLSLTYVNRSVVGTLSRFSTIFIHKTVALIYFSSVAVRRLKSFRNGRILTALLIILLLIFSLWIPQILMFFDPAAGNKYVSYFGLDTSESPYLIYVKILWAALHLWILSRINRVKKLDVSLYSYYQWIVVVSIAFLSNPLISSRILSAVDFVLPVIYSSCRGRITGRLYILGITLMIIYALVSPFIFQMYKINFKW